MCKSDVDKSERNIKSCTKMIWKKYWTSFIKLFTILCSSKLERLPQSLPPQPNICGQGCILQGLKSLRHLNLSTNIRVGSKVADFDKRTSLLWNVINYSCKKFCERVYRSKSFDIITVEKKFDNCLSHCPT
jgi:hypothetical protein